MPQLLLNGSVGIAVGMATNIPPHNLGELVDAIIYLIDHPRATVVDLFQFIKGPDFPTGGEIFDRKGMIQVYSIGRGPIVMRAKAEIVESSAKKAITRFQIIINEIPYGVNKATLITKMADLVKDKKIIGIKDIRDESDRDGIRVVIELKNDSYPKKILNQLLKLTDLQKTFHMNMLALVDGIQPQVLSLVGFLEEYVKHRQIIVIRRAQFDLKQAQARAHILEGLKKALDHIDAVIKAIRESATKEIAHKNLMEKFKLSDKQASAILEMRLQTLAGLERKKITDELKEKRVLIKELEALLNSKSKISAVVKNELREIKKKYSDPRRTKVYVHPVGQMKEEELIPKEECVVILTQGGYIKRVNPQNYRAQKRGGKGAVGIKPWEEDVVTHFLSASTLDSVLFFTDQGRVFQIKAYEIPESGRTARGRAIVNILQLSHDEQITAVLNVDKEEKNKYLVMATKNGIIKKTALGDFSNVRKNGLIAIKLRKEDKLIRAKLALSEDEVMIVTASGQSIRFKGSDVRSMGRSASGVIGINLKGDDKVISMGIVKQSLIRGGLALLVVTENGYGKRTKLSAFKKQKRAGSGLKAAKTTEKTGKIISAKILGKEEESLIAISQKGQVIKTTIKSISSLGRATQGVKIMNIKRGDKVASVACM